jgi:hypothetical protein
MDAAPRRRGPLYLVAGLAVVAVVAIAVLQSGGNPAPAATTADSGAKVTVGTPDSGAAVGRGPDSAAAARLGGAAPVTANSTTVAPVVGRPATPGLDSAANRSRGSIFAVTRGRVRSTGFLANAEGLVLTSSAAVGASPTVDVFLDGSRRVAGRVVLVDSARGLAAILVNTRNCPSSCAPIPLAPDRVQLRQGDSVMAMVAPTLVSPGARPKGALTNATAQRLTAALGVSEAGTGAPVFLPDGHVLGVVRSGGGRSVMLVPSSVARAFLRAAQAERTSKNLQAPDSLLPSWPARPLAADEIAAGIRRTSQDLDAFRVRVARAPFEALVMTPQILALRNAEADTLRKYFNPGLSTSTFCDGSGPCDPIEAWGGLNDYLSERRGVVVIQVAPSQLPPPYRGEHARPDMNRRPAIFRVELARAGVPVAPIEAHRIFSVINPTERYPRTSARCSTPAWRCTIRPPCSRAARWSCGCSRSAVATRCGFPSRPPSSKGSGAIWPPCFVRHYLRHQWPTPGRSHQKRQILRTQRGIGTRPCAALVVGLLFRRCFCARAGCERRGHSRLFQAAAARQRVVESDPRRD